MIPGFAALLRLGNVLTFFSCFAVFLRASFSLMPVRSSPGPSLRPWRNPFYPALPLLHVMYVLSYAQ
uniref:Uncharacterized protein n=1 Tax=Salmonella sp. TaxID=599 RepID=A0A482ETA6_SALSP|nr:hypothetical protein NNIBIDOC_00107 [Salmonella sp.]